MRDQLLQIARSNSPALVEAHRGESGKLISGQAKELEPGSATLDRHALFTDGSDFYRSGWKLSRDFAELLCRNRNRSRGFHIRRYFSADGNVQICTGELDSLISRLEQDVRQDRQRGLGWNACRYRGETFL